jgi:TP901 family phage tail tape measure protein
VADSNTIGKLFVQLLLDDDEFDTADAEKKIKAFGLQLDGFASAMEGAFATAAKAVAAATAGIVASSAVVGATFQAQMTQVGVIAGATGEEFGALEAKARDLGATTAFSATEAATAMGILAGAGLSVNEVITATGSVLNLAGAGGTTLDVAASSLASTLSQFGLSAGEATRVTDVFAKVTAASQFRVEDLAEAMKYGGAVGAGFGWSLEETTAALAMFRDMGLQGSMAGTALRSSMVGATQASHQNVAVMAKYGLTMAEVNPETHSFAEILATVGKAGMTTSDAMVVFGNEAGAAFASLARGVASGDTKYQEMIATLEDSSGAASEMFGAMQDNVMGSFKELQSGAEEVLLSIFDSMKAPLAQVLDALSSTLAEVIAYFQANAPQITERLQAQADKFGAWLQENRQLIAVTFTEGAQAVVTLIEVLGQLAPILDELVILLTAMFVAKKVLDFAMAIQTAVEGLMALRTAILAADAAIAVSTGGMYAVVIAIGALVVALGTLIYSYTSATAAADRLKSAQERLAATAVKADTERAEALDRYLVKKKEEAQAELEAGAASGSLSAARKKELELILSLTGATAQQMEAAGKLLVVNGELRTVGGIADEGDVEAVAALTQRIDSFQAAAAKAKADAAELESVIATIGEQSDGMRSITLTSGTRVVASDLETLGVKVQAFKEQATEYAQAAESLKADYGKATVSILEDAARAQDAMGKGASELARSFGATGEAAEKAARQAEEAWVRAFQSATAAGAGALEAAREGYEDSLADQEEKLRLSHQRELRDLSRSEAKALAEVEDNEVARLIVTEQFSQARALVEKRQAVEVRHFQWDQTKKELDEKKAALEKKQEAERKAEEERRAIRARSLAALTSMERGAMKESERIDAERTDFFSENTDLTLEEKEKAEGLFADRKKAALNEERAATIAAVKKTAEDVAAVLSTVAGVVMDVGKALLQFGGYIVQGLTGIVDVAGEVVTAITSIFDTLTGGTVSLDVLGYIQEAMDAITAGEAGGASVGDVAASFVEEMAANASLFTDSLVEALPDVVAALLTAIPDLIGKVAEALPILAEQVAAMVPDLVTLLAENIPILIQGIVDALPIVVEALVSALPALVAVVAEAVPMILDAVVTNLPILIQGIASAIPDLVQVIVENLPTVVQGIVDNLPMVVEAIAAAIPDIVTAVAEAIPSLVQAVVDALPLVIQAVVDSIPPIVDALKEAIPVLTKGLMDALPKLVMGLVSGILEMIPTLIEQLPVVIQGIMDLLPMLITAILDAIPGIITSIIQAIPQIVMSILEAIPGIITSIIGGLPDIIIALVKELPGMVTQLVLALTAAVPEIIVALIEALFTELIPAIPLIVYELFKALWESLVDLVDGLIEMLTGWFEDIFGGGDKKDKSSSYSGISYVPATMRGVTLHAGEAVLSADQNARRMFGGSAGASQSNPSAPVITSGQGATGPASSLEALFAVDGRIIDGVLLRANENGRGKVTSMMKRRAGVRSGIKSSGRFKLWSK